MKGMTTRDERGMITVEAVLTLVPFILIVMGIISFINIFMVHNKIQFAMYQVGSELSAYSYFYQALNIRDADLKLKADIDQETTEIDATIEDVTSFLNQVGSLEKSVNNVGTGGWNELGNELENVKTQVQNTAASGQQAVQTTLELVDDPQDLMRNIVYFGIENLEAEVKGRMLGAVASSMIGGYLDSGSVAVNPMTADEYLKAAGIVDGMNGLDFGNCELFSDSQYRMIDIVVEYDLEIFAFKILLDDPTIHVVQRCAIPAWLDGDAHTY